MKAFARYLLRSAILAGLCCGAAMDADLSTVGQWTNKYPFDKIAGGKSLCDQPGVQDAMRAAMGKRFFALSLKKCMVRKGRWPAMARVVSRHGRARRMIAATIR